MCLCCCVCATSFERKLSPLCVDSVHVLWALFLCVYMHMGVCVCTCVPQLCVYMHVWVCTINLPLWGSGGRELGGGECCPSLDSTLQPLYRQCSASSLSSGWDFCCWKGQLLDLNGRAKSSASVRKMPSGPDWWSERVLGMSTGRENVDKSVSRWTIRKIQWFKRMLFIRTKQNT